MCVDLMSLGTKKLDDYWGPGKKQLLGDTKFLEKLLDYDKDHIGPDVIAKVKPYTDNPDFTTDKIKKASIAASGLCCWVHAMVVYDRVSKVVAPKRLALAVATEDLETAQATLLVGDRAFKRAPCCLLRVVH